MFTACLLYTSEYVGAQVNFGLQKTLFEREETLWRSRIQAEQQYLRARNAFTEAQLRVHLALSLIHIYLPPSSL